MKRLAVVFQLSLFLVVLRLSLQLTDINFTLPITKYKSQGVFCNWQAGNDFYLPKYKVTYTVPCKQSEVGGLGIPNHSVERFVTHRQQQYICLLPTKQQSNSSLPLPDIDNHPVTVGLKLLQPMEGTRLTLRQTRLTEFISWEFVYNSKVARKKVSALTEKTNRYLVIGQFEMSNQPTYNPYSGSLVFELQEQDLQNGSGPIRKTKVSIRCGPVECISEANELLETLYEMTVETPLLCSSSLFKRRASEEIQQEIQCTLVIPDSEYDESMKEFQSEINKPFSQEQDSTETEQQDLSSFSELLSAFDQGVREEVEKSKKLLNIVLNSNDQQQQQQPNGIKDLLEGAANDYTNAIEIIEKFIQKQKIEEQERERKREHEKEKKGRKRKSNSKDTDN